MALKLPANNRSDHFVENNSPTSLDHSVKSSKSDNSSFLKSVRGGDFDVVVQFLDSGKVDVQACNNNGLNALHLAAKDGYVDIVSEVLRRNCQVDSKSKKGNTALHVASLAGQLEVVKILIENGADVNVQSQAGFTPLYMAAQENHGDVVRYLLERGANPAIATKDNYTPMAVAVQQNNQEVVEILTEHEQRGKTKLSPLHLAAKKNDVHATIMLLQSEQDPKLRAVMVNDTTKSGFTPLHIASHYGNSNVAKVLVQHGSNVNAKAKSSIFPLHVSSKWGRTAVVDLLLKSDAIVDCRTKDGLTPLHCCSRSGYDEVAELLLDAKADISARTKHGLTPLHMASQGDHVNTARLLIARSAPLDDVTVDYLTPLHVAAHCGSYGCAKLLLENQSQPNARALNGFTPLHIACKKNRIRVIELLVKHGASIDATTETGLTPLHVASFMGYSEVARYLLGEGSDSEARTDKGETCLHLATRGNQLEVMRLLLDKGANVDAQAKENQTPLHSATKTGSVDAVVLLLQCKAFVNAATKENYTPLHAASKEGHHEIVEILLEKGADQSIKTLKSFTPLHMASKYGNVKVGEVLISGGGDVNVESKNGLTPLHLAVHYNQPEMVNLLLQKKSNPQATAKNGYTPLHIAAKYNEVDIAHSLLKHKAKPNAESKNGFSPLHLASQEGHVELVSMLLESKAKVDHRSKNGLTAMHLAAQEDRVPVAEVLAKHQADVDPQTKAGYTPLHTACHFGKLNMIEFLLKKGANVEAVTKAGHTPLHQAAQQGHVLVTQLLLRNKANPNCVTSDGQTPLWIAERLGYLSVVELLKGVTSAQPQNQVSNRYKLVEPETMHDVPMSDEEEEDKDDALNEQSYLYMMGGDMRGLGDDSGPAKDEFSSATMGRTSFSPSDRTSVQENANWIFGKDQAKGIPLESYRGDDMKKPTSQIMESTRKGDSSIQETHFDSDPVKTAGSIASDSARDASSMDPKKPIVRGVSKDQMNFESRRPNGDGSLKFNGYESNKRDSNSVGLERKEEMIPLPIIRPLDNVNQNVVIVSRKGESEPDNVFHAGTIPGMKVDNDDYRQKFKYNKGLVPSSSPAVTHGIPYFKSNISETDSHVFGSTYSGMSYASSFDPDNVVLSRQPIFQGFLVSFMVDARGGAMRGCRHSGIRIIVPPGRASQPTRVTCKLVKKEKVPQLPPMMEGEALASRVLVMGPSGAKFLGPVILEVPHFASLRNNEREIVVWRSDNGQTWREHPELGSYDAVMKAISGSFDDLENAEDLYHRRITRIISNDFPKYFALVTRIRQEVATLGPQGGVITSSIFPQVQAAFPAGALTKPIKLCLQTQCLPDEFVKQMVGSRVSVSPIATVEPRRRKFHRPITITLPLDPHLVANNKNIDKSPSLRLLCSMNDGFDPTEWEDITGTTPMVLNNNCVSFPIAVSARYWLINTPRYKEAVMIATPMFMEASAVPFVANFVVFGKRRDPLDGQLRIFCMTDDKMDKTLESQEKFMEVARSRDIEVSDDRPQWIECHGNLIPVLKSDYTDKQPYINFRAFRENRLSLNVRVRDLSQDATANLLFMSEPRDVKDQTPLCNLGVTLPSMEEQQKVDVAKDVAELQRKLEELRKMDLSDEDQISKTELRLTDIAEYLEQDWIPLAAHLGIDEEDIERIQSQYGYVPEQALVMLHLWMEKNKDVASGNLLERALREIGREDIIQKCIFFLQDVTDENEIQEAKNVIYSSGDHQRLENLNISPHEGIFSSPTGQEEVFQAETENETDIGCEGLMDENVEMSAQLESDEAIISTNTGVESLPALTISETEQFLPHGDILEIKLKAPRAFEDWVESQEMTYDGNGRSELYHDETITQNGITEAEPTNYCCNFSSLNHLLRPGEKEIEVKVEMEDDDQVLDDGTVVKRQVITKSHFAIPHISPHENESGLSERLVKVEIEEDVMELSAGISDLGDLDPGLVSSKTHVSKEAGYFSDCSHGEKIPFERKITKTVITYLGQKQRLMNNPSPIRLPKSFCVESPKYTISSQKMLSDSISIPNDLSMEAGLIVNQALNAAIEQIRTESLHLDYENEDLEDSVAVHVYTDTVEKEPEIETSVKEFEETLEDGTIVKRRIIKTKQKQTIIKRVVMEGPEDELPTNEEQAQEMLKQVECDEEPEMLKSPLFGDDAQHGLKTDVQEFEDVQEDGTVVKRRIVTTTEQQLTTDRVVLEGDISIDEEDANQVFSDNLPERV